MESNAAQGGNPAPLQLEIDGAIKRLPKTHQEAAKHLSDQLTIRTIDHRNKLVKTSRDRSHPDIITFTRAFSAALEARFIPMYPFELKRSNARQARLKSTGVSKAGPGQSPHNYGCAVDMVHSLRYWDLTRVEWDVIGAIGKEVARKRKIKIVWGGDWNFYDPAHWELSNWRDQRAALHSLEDEGVEIPEDDAAYFGMIDQRVKALSS